MRPAPRWPRCPWGAPRAQGPHSADRGEEGNPVPARGRSLLGGCGGLGGVRVPAQARAWHPGGQPVTQRGGWPCLLPGRATPCACVWVSGAENATSELTGLSEQLVDTACKVCQAYLGQLEHEDVDVAEDAAKGLTEDEWKDLTRQYYSLIQ